jgi:hypothetical protein
VLRSGVSGIFFPFHEEEVVYHYYTVACLLLLQSVEPIKSNSGLRRKAMDANGSIITLNTYFHSAFIISCISQQPK